MGTLAELALAARQFPERPALLLISLDGIGDRRRGINDHFRKTCAAVNVTASIHALGPEFFRRALNIVRHYDNFRPDVNPYEDHDCGTFKLDGYECAWALLQQGYVRFFGEFNQHEYHHATADYHARVRDLIHTAKSRRC